MLGEQEEELNRLKRMMDETRAQVKQEVDDTGYLLRAIADESPAAKPAGEAAPRIEKPADTSADDASSHERKPQ
jgi:hypothetical protein